MQVGHKIPVTAKACISLMPLALQDNSEVLELFGPGQAHLAV